MKKFIKVSLLLGFIIFTGCLERQQIPITYTQPVSSNVLVTEAYKHLGKTYQYGATGPKHFDCSGFVYAVHRNVGITLPRTSIHQSQIKAENISRHNLKVGDLVFFDTSNKGHVNHSGIYIGNGKFIHSSSGKAYSVTISDINAWYKDKFKWGKRIHANQ